MRYHEFVYDLDKVLFICNAMLMTVVSQRAKRFIKAIFNFMCRAHALISIAIHTNVHGDKYD